MIHNLVILFSPANAMPLPAVQATLLKPPAQPSSTGTRHHQSSQLPVSRLKFVVSVTGNAVGFAGLIAGCWISLQLMQTYL